MCVEVDEPGYDSPVMWESGGEFEGECDDCGEEGDLHDLGWTMVCSCCVDSARESEVLYAYEDRVTRRAEDGWRDA